MDCLTCAANSSPMKRPSLILMAPMKSSSSYSWNYSALGMPTPLARSSSALLMTCCSDGCSADRWPVGTNWLGSIGALGSYWL